MAESVSVLFVCMGNICRSPTAQGVFRKLVEDSDLGRHIIIDSAGTHAYHVGNPPDRRARETATRRGVDLSDLVARRVTEADFVEFDYVVAMDQDNLVALNEICPPGMSDRLHLFLDFAPHLEVNEVPDPYYGGPTGFERVFDLVEAASAGLLAHIKRHHLA